MRLFSKMMRRIVALAVCLLLVFSGQPFIFAQVLPKSDALAVVPLGEKFSLPVLRGLKFYPNDPLKFDFVIDKGSAGSSPEDLSIQARRLVRYFLACVTMPSKDLWVNLSPYEADRIVPNELQSTDIGRDLLSQDYILKQVASTLTDPKTGLGKQFWQKVYQKAHQKYNTIQIPISTFNKVWIVPDKAVVYEGKDKVLVGEARLKVMLEEDYLATQKNNDHTRADNHLVPNDISSQVMKEVILPVLQEEINSGKNFSQLRQIYHSLVLSVWFKRKLNEEVYRQNILNNLYRDKKKVKGIDSADPQFKEKIYQQYIEAFKKGAYNYIKADFDPYRKKYTRRHFYSGGFDGEYADAAVSVEPETLAPVSLVASVERNGEGFTVNLQRVGDSASEDQGIEGQIGNRGKVSRVAREGQNWYMQVVEPKGNAPLGKVLLTPVGERDLGTVLDQVGHLAIAAVKDEHRKILLNFLKLFEKSPPKIFTFSQRIRDVLGKASAPNQSFRYIAIYDKLFSNPVAMVHEIGEYLFNGKQLRLRLDGQYLVVTFPTLGAEEIRLKLGDEALAIAQKKSGDQHYLLRALQIKICADADRELTKSIKLIQSAHLRVHIPAMDFDGDDRTAWDEYLDVAMLARNIVTQIPEDIFINMLRNVTGNSGLAWSDLGKDVYVEHVKDGTQKRAYKLTIPMAGTNEKVVVLLAFKHEKYGGSISPQEIATAATCSGKGMPRLGGTGLFKSGKVKIHWIIEEFIVGPTVGELDREGKLTDSVRRGVVDNLLWVASQLKGVVPTDIHGDNFIAGNEIVLVDAGEYRLPIFGSKASLENRLQFLLALVANYGHRDYMDPAKDHVIFDALEKSLRLAPGEGRKFLEDAYNELVRMGDVPAAHFFYEKGKNMTWVLGSKDQGAAAVEPFIPYFRKSLAAYLGKNDAGVSSDDKTGGVDFRDDAVNLDSRKLKTADGAQDSELVTAGILDYDISPENFVGFDFNISVPRPVIRWANF